MITLGATAVDTHLTLIADVANAKVIKIIRVIRVILYPRAGLGESSS